MGARGLDKRGSFFKVKGSPDWDLHWAACSLCLLPGELQALSAAAEGSLLSEPAPASWVCLSAAAGLLPCFIAGWGFCDLVLHTDIGLRLREMPHCVKHSREPLVIAQLLLLQLGRFYDKS